MMNQFRVVDTRFFGHKSVLVTTQQVHPLKTHELSDYPGWKGHSSPPLSQIHLKPFFLQFSTSK